MFRRISLALLFMFCSAAGYAQGLSRNVPGPVRSVQTNGTTSATVGTFTAATPDGGDVRHGCKVYNTSTGVLYAFLKQRNGATATVAASVPVVAGALWPCPDGEQDELDLAGSIAGATYVLIVW